MVFSSPPLPLQPRRQLLRSDRMDEDETAELLGLGPDRMKLRIGELQALDAAADRHAAQAELLDAVFELLHREVGVLHRDRREGDEAVGMRRDERGKLLVLQLDHRFGLVALGVVPERIDADRLHVDALLVHRLEAVGANDKIGRPELEPHHVHDLRKHAVRVHVDGLDAAAVDDDLPAPHRGLRMGIGRMQKAAAAEHNAGHRAGGTAQEISAGCHFGFSRLTVGPPGADAGPTHRSGRHKRSGRAICFKQASAHGFRYAPAQAIVRSSEKCC